jgi:hypothetical protein
MRAHPDITTPGGFLRVRVVTKMKRATAVRFESGDRPHRCR